MSIFPVSTFDTQQESEMLQLQLLVLFAAATLSLLCNRYLALRRNVKLAREINLPYVILPFYAGGLIWVISYTVIAPFLKSFLPRCLQRGWIEFTFVYWTWSLGYKPFQKLGSDTILIVSPGGITIFTSSPEIIAQVGRRHKEFLKPTRLYKIVDAFGSNLVSSNGLSWRRQRKAITPSFTEGNNSLVWAESIYQTKCMLAQWDRCMQSSSKASQFDIQDDLKTLAFHILNRAGFGVRLQWPRDIDAVKDGSFEKQDIHKIHDFDDLEGGQGMRFGDAMLLVVDHLKELFIFPKWFLKHAPSKTLNKTWLAHKEIELCLGKYISCQQNSFQDEASLSNLSPNIRSSLIENALRNATCANMDKALTKDEIIGNCFTSLVAGHETSGSTLFFALICLALNPSWQRLMQAEIDRLFGTEEPSEWSYSQNVGNLFGSYIDAVLSETLRLFPPANIIPKHTSPGGPHVLRYENREIHIPSNTAFNILAPSTHQNPNYWPHEPSIYHSGNDLDEYKPDRWFSSLSEAVHQVDSGVELGSDLDDSSSNTKRFFSPKKGAFIPYSIGQRECIGKRFAQIEMLVVMAVIFRDWSVELVIDGEEDLSHSEKQMAWETTRDMARAHLKTGMEHYMTMQLKKGLVPLRVVKRGSERAC